MWQIPFEHFNIRLFLLNKTSIGCHQATHIILLAHFDYLDSKNKNGYPLNPDICFSSILKLHWPTVPSTTDIPGLPRTLYPQPQDFPIFLHSSTSVYYCPLEPEQLIGLVNY